MPVRIVMINIVLFKSVKIPNVTGSLDHINTKCDKVTGPHKYLTVKELILCGFNKMCFYNV